MTQFLWNMDQQHLLLVTVKNSDGGLRVPDCDLENLQYKLHPDFGLLPDRFSKTVSIMRRVLY